MRLSDQPPALPRKRVAAKPAPIRFGQGDIENVLDRLDDAAIDTLSFGTIELDGRGIVRRYNATEQLITGRRSVDVVGKHFFDEVAPCARRPQFRGRFEAGVRNGDLDVTFEYVFDYKMNPTRVRIRMKKGLALDCYWVLVTRLDLVDVPARSPVD